MVVLLSIRAPKGACPKSLKSHNEPTITFSSPEGEEGFALSPRETLISCLLVG